MSDIHERHVATDHIGHDRDVTLAQIVHQREIRQAEHLERAALLEDGYNINIDDLRRLYTDIILDGNGDQSAVIERWIALCDTLRSTDKRMVALVGTKTELAPGCHGFGGPAKYESKSDIIIITNPREAAISFGENEHAWWAGLDAQGYRLLQPFMRDEVTFDDLTEDPLDLRVAIASRSKHAAWEPAYDLLSVVAAGDDFSELTRGVETALITEGGALRYEQLVLDRSFNQLSNAWWRTARKQRAAETSARDA